MPQAVFVLWTILLAVAVLLLPIIVALLHTTLKASRSIERYFAQMLEAGVGIANNTEHIKALNDTISVAGGILSTAGDVNEHAQTIKTALGERALKWN